MTEVLTQEQLQEYKEYIETHKAFDSDFAKALNTIKALTDKVEVTLMQAVEFRNERDELKGQVAASREIISDIQNRREVSNSRIQNFLRDSKSTVKDYNYRVTRYEREKAIREVIVLVDEQLKGIVNPGDIEALLTKEQA